LNFDAQIRHLRHRALLHNRQQTLSAGEGHVRQAGIMLVAGDAAAHLKQHPPQPARPDKLPQRDVKIAGDDAVAFGRHFLDNLPVNQFE
jgi:hypothetical protein